MQTLAPCNGLLRTERGGLTSLGSPDLGGDGGYVATFRLYVESKVYNKNKMLFRNISG